MKSRRYDREIEADALEIALQYADAGNPPEDGRVQVAGLLRPGVQIRETVRAQTKERALRAFDTAHRGDTPDPDAGTRDSHHAAVFTAHVEVGDTRVRMADVERIDAEKAAQVAAAAKEAASLEVTWDADL